MALVALGAFAFLGTDLLALASNFRARDAAKSHSHFGISASRVVRTIGQGESARIGFWVVRSAGYSRTLRLSTTGQPERSVVRFTSSPVGPKRSYTRMTVSTYPDVAPGTYTIKVKARGRVGKRSVVRSSSFTLVVRRNEAFTVSGGPDASLGPGVARPLNLRITNPNPFPIKVIRLEAAVAEGTSSPACSGTANFAVTPMARDRLERGIHVPANSAQVLSDLGVPADEMPVLRMLNLPVDQAACKGVSFSLGYTGVAVRR